jgi:hypothetical protein
MVAGARDEGARDPRQVKGELPLHLEGHGGQVEGARAAPRRRQRGRGGRDLGVGRLVQAVAHLPARALVEEPGAEAGTAERPHARQVHTARGERLQGRGRIVVAAHAGHARGQSPEARPQGGVEGRATGLRHPRAPVGEDHVVHEQVAEDDEVGDHGARTLLQGAWQTRTRWAGIHGPDLTRVRCTLPSAPSLPYHRRRALGLLRDTFPWETACPCHGVHALIPNSEGGHGNIGPPRR